MSQSLLFFIRTHSTVCSLCSRKGSYPSLIMRTQVSLSIVALSLYASTSFAKHIPPQNILWGERGPAGATLLPTTKTSLKPDPVEERDSVCTNDPTHRSCWASGYSVATDFDAKTPPAGKPVSVSAPASLSWQFESVFHLRLDSRLSHSTTLRLPSRNAIQTATQAFHAC